MSKRLTSWIVPYVRTARGTVVVEAYSQEDAEAAVDAGAFDPDPGEEMTDWKATGHARRNE